MDRVSQFAFALASTVAAATMVAEGAHAQSAEEMGAAVVNFLLRNPTTANRTKPDERAALEVIRDLLTTQAQRAHELDYARAGTDNIIIQSGDGRRSQLVRNQSGDVFLVVDGVIYPVALTLVSEAAGQIGLGGQRQAPVSTLMSDAINQFLDAVRANDIPRMGQLWGSARGPASEWMSDSELHRRMTVVQRYLNAHGYRIVEGPLAVPGRTDRRMYQVELQRAQCPQVQPIEIVQTRRGGWIVADVHLESVGTPGCW